MEHPKSNFINLLLPFCVNLQFNFTVFFPHHAQCGAVLTMPGNQLGAGGPLCPSWSAMGLWQVRLVLVPLVES